MQERKTSPMLKTVLITSLSLNVFTLSALAMYGTWLVTSEVALFERGIASLLVFVATFVVGTLLFWKVISMLAGAEN
ncbi:MAG TPA: hypothetical protein VFF30_12555 [Nitrososphaerales archaeon]|nr:hypothetical protein [Nitrososphaerales archaeon]